MRGISTFSFALNYWLTDWSPSAFRMVNIFLHFINGCLVWTLTRLLLERVGRLETGKGKSEQSENQNRHRNYSGLIAFFTAAWFVSHPVLTSGVAYIFQRNGILSTLFYLSAFHFLLKAFPLDGKTKPGWAMASAAAYLLSTWSKAIGITFIAVVFLFEWLLQPAAGRRNRTKFYIPFVLVSAFSLFAAYWQMVKTPILKRTMYGDWGVWSNVITQWNTVIEYLKLVFWPHPDRLNIDHDFPITLSILDDRAWLSGLILAALIIAAVIIRKKHRLITFSILWFFIALIPESTVIPISEVMVEYRLYLPAFGFSLALVLSLHALCAKFWSQKFFPVAGLCILAMFSIFTWQRNHILSSEFLVWEDAARKGPHNIRANTAYATFLLKRGNREDAMKIYKKVVELNEMRLPFKLPTAIPHNEWGVYLFERGDRQAAKKQFLAALHLNLWYQTARENLARALEQESEENYVKAYREVLRQVDYFPLGHYNLGNHYLGQKIYSKAIEEYQTAVRQDPDFFKAYNNLGIAHGYMGNDAKAKEMFEKALSLNSDYRPAQTNLDALLKPAP